MTTGQTTYPGRDDKHHRGTCRMYVNAKIQTTITTVISCVATAVADAAAKGGDQIDKRPG
jgi:hypothetical protein